MSEQHLKIRFSCSSCGAKYTAALEQAGKQGNCKKCGNQISVPEPKLNENQHEIPFEQSEPKPNNKSLSQHNFYVAFALCLALGWLGLHRFYVKKAGTGLLQLFTFGGFVIWWLADLVLLLNSNFKDEQALTLVNPNRKVTISVTVAFFLFVAIGGGGNNKSNTSDSSISNEITTSAGFIWENIDYSNGIYTNLAFYDDGSFRTTAYKMQGSLNNLSPLLTLEGNWESSSNGKSARGTYSVNGVPVKWNFNRNYSSLTNNKGIIFNRTKVK